MIIYINVFFVNYKIFLNFKYEEKGKVNQILGRSFVFEDSFIILDKDEEE